MSQGSGELQLDKLIDSLDSVPKEPDDLTAAAIRKNRAEAHEAEARATGAWQDIEERKTYANRLFGVVVGWLVLDGATVMLVGFGNFARYPFFLSDTVIVALLTTSTATVVGLLVIVARYLFARSGSGPS